MSKPYRHGFRHPVACDAVQKQRDTLVFEVVQAPSKAACCVPVNDTMREVH